MSKSFLQKELEKRALPDLLFVEGVKISTSAEWEEIARPYWRNMLLNEEYGKRPCDITPTVTVTPQFIDFAGKAKWEEVVFRFEKGGKEHTVPTQLIYPADGKKHPFFIYLNFRPDIPDRYLPVEEIIDNGFGIFTVCYSNVTPDDCNFTAGLPLLFQEGERAQDDTGKIGYWAYMASKMMDYLLTRPEADEKGIGVAGHSRLGKTALLTAALDERFAFACANDSGCSGAALSRYASKAGEKIDDICRKFPFWFAPAYTKYANNEKNLPFDQHALLALIAPRAAFVGGAVEDLWADNDNQFLNAYAVTPVWNLYDKTGLITPDDYPKVGDILTDGEVGFHLRAGKHYHSRTDWLVYMDGVKKYLSKQN